MIIINQDQFIVSHKQCDHEIKQYKSKKIPQEDKKSTK